MVIFIFFFRKWGSDWPRSGDASFHMLVEAMAEGPINPQLPGTANNQTVMTTISNGGDLGRAFKR